MKKMMMIAISIFAVISLLGLVTVSNAIADGKDGDCAGNYGQGYGEEMIKFRDIMHNAVVKTEPLEEGVRITVTGEQKELIASIKAELGPNRQEPLASYPGTITTSKELENGVALTVVSSDSETVIKIKALGNDLFNDVLRDHMHGQIAGQGGFRGHYQGRMDGPGDRGAGWGHHYGNPESGMRGGQNR